MTNITTRSTKADLVAHIAALNTELRASALTVQELRTQLSIAKASAPHAPRVVPARNHQLPAHFIAAREAAMRMGRTVQVTA